MTANDNIEFRKATVADIGDILEIINDAILKTTSLYDYHIRTLEYQTNWFKIKEENKKPVLVAEFEGRVIGFGSFDKFRAWDAYQFSVEHSVYVAESFRSKGIGKEILRRLIQLAKQEGYHTMIAGIDAQNFSSISLHRNLGFVELCTFKEVGYKFERWLDLTFMQLMLK